MSSQTPTAVVCTIPSGIWSDGCGAFLGKKQSSEAVHVPYTIAQTVLGSVATTRNRRGGSTIPFWYSTPTTARLCAMPLVPLIAVIMIFAIPILGIVFAGYKEWLKFKARHRELGTSTREVEDRLRTLRERLDGLEQERDALQDRVQNLETIVTSEAWIAAHDDSAGTPFLDAAEADELTLHLDRESSSEGEAERTAEIARRLRGE